MYLEYFGLNKLPFRITPDTHLFFEGSDRGATLNALCYVISQGEGIVKVVGEVGSGKTMLCRMLPHKLPDNIDLIYLANPSLSPDNTLHAIAQEMGLKVVSTTEKITVMHLLQKTLVERHAQGRQVVVLVEEAQGMPLETLEEIRLLSNLETDEQKLLQIVLFGQPELDDNLANPRIRQLKERITHNINLQPMLPQAIRSYLNFRMRSVGYNGTDLFDDKTVTVISRYSKGLLRRVNIIADKALLAAFVEGRQEITVSDIHQAARESEFKIENRWISWFRGAAAALVMGAIVAGAAISFSTTHKNIMADTSQSSRDVNAEQHYS